MRIPFYKSIPSGMYHGTHLAATLIHDRKNMLFMVDELGEYMERIVTCFPYGHENLNQTGPYSMSEALKAATSQAEQAEPRLKAKEVTK